MTTADDKHETVCEMASFFSTSCICARIITMFFRKITEKLTAVLLACFLCSAVLPVHAENDYSDTSKWTQKCSDLTKLNENDKNACAGYMQYMSSRSADLKKQLSQIDQKRSDVSTSLEQATKKISDYQKQIKDLTDQVNQLQKQIDAQNEKIASEEKKEADLKTDVKEQIEGQQSGMRLSKYTDIIMGASSFEDLLRILNGLDMITQKSDALLKEYQAVEEQLKKDRDTLAAQKEKVQNTQNDILAKSYAVQVEKEQYEAQKKELAAQYADTKKSSDALTKQQKELVAKQQEARKNYEKALAAQAAKAAAAKKAAEQAKRNASGSGSGKSSAKSGSGAASGSSSWNGTRLSRSNGSVNGPSGKETYYNLPMGGVVNILKGAGVPGDYWVRSDGVKMYGSYVLIAADQSIRPLGSLVETSLGMGIVGDTGTFIYSNHTQIDIAVTW